MRGIDIGLATVHQQSAEAALQHQIHLLRHHSGVVYIQGREEFMGKVMGGALLLVGELV
ncbi:hypothetical protein D3C79_1079480 [compost metagenome]